MTNNGAVRSLDKPLGNALRYACGYNYKNATIDKYLRELKYLQVATDLINCNARFWSDFWKPYDHADRQLACYYIDGNVKPLWSSKRCRKSQVPMLGRVMGCLEIELIDSTEPGYIYEDVAVHVQWDNGKESCLVTSIPATLFEASEDEERQLKERSKIKNGKRIQSCRNQEALKACQRHIRKIQREIKAITEPFKKPFTALQQKSKEFARIQHILNFFI